MEDSTKKPDAKKPRGARSFCIPRAAINALLSNEATAYEVCAYLTLAAFTEEKWPIFISQYQCSKPPYRGQ